MNTYAHQRRNPLDSWLRYRLLIRIRCKVSDRGPAIMTGCEESVFRLLLSSNSPRSPFLTGLSTIVGWLRILFMFLNNNKIRCVNHVKLCFISCNRRQRALLLASFLDYKNQLTWRFFKRSSLTISPVAWWLIKLPPTQRWLQFRNRLKCAIGRHPC